jgi:predicted nucleic-acid-binding protein
MIGLDTNIMVRYVAQDNKEQSIKATRLIESLSAASPGYVGIITLVEMVWVMQGCYAATRQDICAVLKTLLQTREIVVAKADIVWQALRLFKEGKADFADCLIERLASEAGCDYTATFDRNASKYCGMRLIA